MDEARTRRRVIVRGRVQGVAFRATAVERAHALGVAGWVCNRPDGAVEAVVEGEPARVEAMVAWCREGPPWARVDGIEIHEEAAEKLRSFEIRR